ncbi:MAG: methyltransferase [Sediminibacterium sp.]|jgi:tRNA1Val (adenine37-N6)-methyltransferase|nr:MAG: methyltransferase [Sediminibacterium sp.]
MKVCTDACLFGAWVSSQTLVQNANNIVDIGTGTGLLSLMLAQVTETSKASITAIEIESQAAAEASSNFNISKWSNRLKLVNDSIQNFTANIVNGEFVSKGLNNNNNNNNNNLLYDIVISNPPFYEGDLKSPDANKNKAAHSTELPWSILVENVVSLLIDAGSFFVLVPTLRAYTMQKLAEAHQLQLVEEVLVYNDVKHLPFRSFLHFKKNTNTLNKEISVLRNKIVIKNTDNTYSSAFTELLKDYYLHL